MLCGLRRGKLADPILKFSQFSVPIIRKSVNKLISLTYLFYSAKTAHNIENAFLMLTRAVVAADRNRNQTLAPPLKKDRCVVM